MDSIRYLTQSHLAELTGKDRATVRKRLEGLEPHSQDGRAKYFDAHVALPMILLIENTRGIDRELQEEKLRYETAKADRMELDVAQRKGQLVEIESIAQAVEKEYTAVRAALKVLPTRMAMPLAPITDPSEIQDLLDKEINKTLQNLSLDATYTELEKSNELHDEDESREQIDPESTLDPEAESETKPS